MSFIKHYGNCYYADISSDPNNKRFVELSINKSIFGTVSGEGNFAIGSPVTIIATPNEGYAFEGWYNENILISTESEYTFIINKPLNLTAKFIEEVRIVAKFNITNTNASTRIAYTPTNFSKIEIDNIEQQDIISSYTFSTTGEHIVRYTLSDSTIIENNTFSDCINLKSITIPNSVTSIGDRAFSQCNNLTGITIPNSITSIGNYAFQGCTSLTSCTIGSGVTNIGSYAFNNCKNLTSITIPDNVTNIGEYAFYQCSNLKTVNSNIEGELIIPNNITIISDSIFRECSGFTKIMIHNNITSVGHSAFEYCTNVTDVIIGSSVTSFGHNSLARCPKLTSITCNATVAPSLKQGTFYGISNGGSLYVPQNNSGYTVWMGTGLYYLGYYRWTKIEQ